MENAKQLSVPLEVEVSEGQRLVRSKITKGEKFENYI